MAHKQQPFVIGLTSTHGDQAWLNKNSRNYLNMLANAGVHVVSLHRTCPPSCRMARPMRQARPVACPRQCWIICRG